MTEKILFGLIGLLMFSITGVGVTAAIAHPEEAAKIVPEAISTVEKAVGDASGTLARTVSTVFTGSGDAESDDTSVLDDESRTSEPAQSKIADSGHETAFSGDYDDDGDGSEEENEDGDGDDEGFRGSQQLSVAPTASTASQTSGSQTSQATQSTQTSSVRSFTMQEVASHASATSCYSAINGSVYDLTSFINQHPGGSAAIKSLCGVDGTAAFNGQHGGQGRPASELASLKIGILAK